MSNGRTILFLNHNFRGKGTYFRNFHLARVLACRGWDCTLLTVRPERSVRATIEISRGVRVIEMPHFVVPRRLAASGFCPWDVLHRCLHVARRRYDVVFVSDHLPDVSFPFYLARLLSPSTLFVADWADKFTDGGLHDHWNTPWGKPAYLISRSLEYGVKRRANLCTATSRPLLRLLREKLGIPAAKTLHLPSGCDTSIPYPPSMAEARRAVGLPQDALIVGRTSSSDLITASECQTMHGLAARLRRFHPRPFILYLVGPCDPSRYPTLFSAGLDVRCTGRLPPEQVPLHVACCDLFLLIEDDHPNCRYRGPIRLNDYLAAGRPLICNSVGDHVSTLLEHGVCVVCDDVTKENRELDELLRNPERRFEMGRKARALAEGDLSWERLGRRLEEFILREGLRENPPPTASSAASPS